MTVLTREKEFWDQHEEFDWMAESSKHAVVAMLPRLEGDVLELCIGSGMLTEHLPRTYRTYTGVDISSSLLSSLRRTVPAVSPVQANAQELCFANESFDGVVVFAGLHHLPEFARAIAEAFRVLRPGGVFVCLEPSSRAWYRPPMTWLRNWIGIYSDDEVFLDSRRVSRIMEAAGLSKIRTRFLTPSFNPAFLNRKTRLLAYCLYGAAALGRSWLTQSFFLTTAYKAAGRSS